jgi:hypothetical protein
MTTVPHSALNESQLKQVMYLFADEVFGTDAAAYLYELDQRGAVTGRKPLSLDAHKTRKVKRTQIHIMQHTSVSADQVRRAQTHMEALAASIAEAIYQQQLEEVTHE